MYISGSYRLALFGNWWWWCTWYQYPVFHVGRISITRYTWTWWTVEVEGECRYYGVPGTGTSLFPCCNLRYIHHQITSQVVKHLRYTNANESNSQASMSLMSLYMKNSWKHSNFNLNNHTFGTANSRLTSSFTRQRRWWRFFVAMHQSHLCHTFLFAMFLK